jgi:hypothetical protein
MCPDIDDLDEEIRGHLAIGVKERIRPDDSRRLGLAWRDCVVLLVMLLPLQIAGFFSGPRAWSSPVTWAVWLPLLVFELMLAAWLITKGVATPAARRSA